MKTLNNYLKKINQKAGAELFFLIVAIIFALFVTMGTLSVSPPDNDEVGAAKCSNLEKDVIMKLPQGAQFPDPKLPVTNPAGMEFQRIMRSTPIIQKQVEAHFNNLGKVTYKGKDRVVYSAWFNLADKQMSEGVGKHVSAVNYVEADGIENLLFVDMTEDQDPRQEGMLYIEIYLKKGVEIPKFINDYCDSADLFAQLYSGFSFIRDQDGKTIPPLSFNVKDLQNSTSGSKCWTDIKGECPFADDEEFYLFGYAPRTFNYGVGASVYEETISKPPFYTKKGDGCGSAGCNNLLPQGDLTVLYNGAPKKFRFEWYPQSSSKWGALFDRDANGPLGQVMFYYAPKRSIGPAIKPGPDLAKPLSSDWNNSTLQLRAIEAKTIPSWGWWTPECKPAIYLYPKTAMNVNVKVDPQGIFKYTDPIYNKDTGWNVKAYPTGQLEWLDSAVGIDSRGNTKGTAFYDYLYYESKIPDTLIEKPTDGFIVAYNDLENFYRTTLPQLGLNQKEIQDYVEFWQNSLPVRDYYFIGIVDPLLVNVLEPITINPLPDNILRVRFYYEGLQAIEALERMKTINAPKLETYFIRKGFSLVEWGGFVKRDDNHPFTCSM